MNTLKYIALSLLFFISIPVIGQEAYEIRNIKILEVNSSINPATLNYLENNLKKLQAKNHDAVIIKLDTPGGLITTTKDIMTVIGSSDYPVIIWVTPEGASATSAGAIISSASHLLFMSEGTNIGAATPVGLGKDIEKSDGKDKAINDLVALVTSLSKSRGRNAEKFQLMISEAKSYDAQTALKDKIINGIANSTIDLIQKTQNQKIKILGTEYLLTIHPQAEIKTIEMDPGQKILNIFSNPMTAYILFIIGAALLYFEFQAPGGFIAGSIGVICLVLAGIGFQVLPLNFGALGLVILSFILFILEAYITSYGVLTLAGIASLIFGSLFLFRTEDSYLAIQTPIIFSVITAIIIYVAILGLLIFKTRKKKQKFFETTDHIGHIANFVKKDGDEFHYQVKVNGEIWNTITKEEFKLNDKVKVIEQINETMLIKIIRV